MRMYFLALALASGVAAYTCSDAYSDAGYMGVTVPLIVISATTGTVGSSTVLQTADAYGGYGSLRIKCSSDLTQSQLVVYHPMMGDWRLNLTNVTGFGVNNYGQFVVNYESSSIKTYGSAQPEGTYVLAMDYWKEGLLIINNTAQQTVWNSNLTSYQSSWAYKFSTGSGFPSVSTVIGNLNGVRIYALDSIANDSNPDTSHQALVNVIMDTATASISTSTVQITLNSTTNVINERTFVQGVYNVYQTANNDAKIINFSGEFDNGNSNVTNCAIQWAFNSGIYFVSAAGNSNKSISAKNPYQILVGAADFDYANAPQFDYTKTPPQPVYSWSMSNYGPAIDIWAGNQFNYIYMHGTSVAAAFTSAIVGYAISQNFKSLKSNPASGYEFIKQTARTDLFTAPDFKVSQSTNAAKKFVSMLTMSTKAIPTATSPTINYCGSLNLPYSKPTAANWGSLINLANTNNLGHLVASFSTGGNTMGFTR